jgi:hypothetical protein
MSSVSIPYGRLRQPLRHQVDADHPLDPEVRPIRLRAGRPAEPEDREGAVLVDVAKATACQAVGRMSDR